MNVYFRHQQLYFLFYFFFSVEYYWFVVHFNIISSSFCYTNENSIGSSMLFNSFKMKWKKDKKKKIKHQKFHRFYVPIHIFPEFWRFMKNENKNKAKRKWYFIFYLRFYVVLVSRWKSACKFIVKWENINERKKKNKR